MQQTPRNLQKGQKEHSKKPAWASRKPRGKQKQAHHEPATLEKEIEKTMGENKENAKNQQNISKEHEAARNRRRGLHGTRKTK